MNANIENKENHTLVSLTGSLDLYKVGSLKKQLSPLLEGSEVSCLVVDLENLEYMDSSGIALMAYLRKKMMQKDGSFYLMKTGEGILQVMRLAALDKFFTYIDSESEIKQHST